MSQSGKSDKIKLMDCGARCSECPLKDSNMAHAEKNAGAKIAIVLDDPTEVEIRYNKPIVGPNTKTFSEALSENKIDRNAFHITYAVPCQTPMGDLQKFTSNIAKQNRKIEQQNKKRLASGLEPIPLLLSPQECCRPRLQEEIKPFKKIITMGTFSTREVVKKDHNILKMRGIPELIDNKKVLPTIHYGLANATLKWGIPFKHDIAKALQYFADTHTWTPPTVIFHPTQDQLLSFIARNKSGIFSYDLETDGIDPLECNIRCVGIGTKTEVVLIGLQGIDSTTRFYSSLEEHNVLETLKNFFSSEQYIKVGWNVIAHDNVILSSRWGIESKSVYDAMLYQRAIESELQHSLAFAASMYSNAPNWKIERKDRRLVDIETDAELHLYCAYDVAICAEVFVPILQKVNKLNLDKCVKHDHVLQTIGAKMHRLGFCIDGKALEQVEKNILEKIRKHKNAIATILQDNGIPMDEVNPGSSSDVRQLLYTHWNLSSYLSNKLSPKEYLTSTGEISTNDDVMKALLTVVSLTPEQREAIEHIRLYRRDQKILGTYLSKLRTDSQEVYGGWDENETMEDKEYRMLYSIEKKGIIHEKTKRVHCGYSVHTNLIGDIQDGRPFSIQSLPRYYRDIVVPSVDNVFIGIHIDQLEMRVIASRWDLEQYKVALMNGLDVHDSVTAPLLFGERYVSAPEEAKQKMRNISRIVLLLSQYGQSLEIVHQNLIGFEVEDDLGDTVLPYWKLTIRELRALHTQLMGRIPFGIAWEKELESYRSLGYVVDPIYGRRKDFLDGENLYEVVWYSVQSHVKAIFNSLLVQVNDLLLENGIVTCINNHIVVELSKEKAQQLEEKINLISSGFLFDSCPNMVFPLVLKMGRTLQEAL